MIRIRATLSQPVPFHHVSEIKNVIEFAATRGGAALRSHAGPSRWGWGFVTEPGDKKDERRLRSLSFGTTDQDAEQSLRHITAEWLQESAAAAGITLSIEGLVADPLPDFSGAILAHPITPIRVLDSTRQGRRRAILQLNAVWQEGLNRTMSYRFGRPFALQVNTDPAALWSTARPVRSQPLENKTLRTVVGLPGIVVPFVLEGSPEDLRAVWASGCGSGTGMGFGWIDDALTASLATSVAQVI